MRLPSRACGRAGWSALVCGLLLMTGSGEGAPEDKARWDRKYRGGEHAASEEPVAFLREHVALLPRGRALDLAMGAGRNGVYLASQGFEVLGIDISEEGLRQARALAARRGVSIETRAVDLEGYRLPAETYEVVICTYYLQRDLFPQIRSALVPGGMALVETFTVDQLRYRPGMPRAYLLEPGELLALFDGMRVLRYQEKDDGSAAFASILVQKPRPGAPVPGSPR